MGKEQRGRNWCRNKKCVLTSEQLSCRRIKATREGLITPANVPSISLISWGEYFKIRKDLCSKFSKLDGEEYMKDSKPELTVQFVLFLLRITEVPVSTLGQEKKYSESYSGFLPYIQDDETRECSWCSTWTIGWNLENSLIDGQHDKRFISYLKVQTGSGDHPWSVGDTSLYRKEIGYKADH